MIEIDEKEYKQLKEAQQRLEALEEAGVDNWEGYGFACRIMQEAGVFDEEE